MWRLALPGAVGAFFGALFLSSLPVHMARPAVSAFLFILGVAVLIRFARPNRQTPGTEKPLRAGFDATWPHAGFFDATGGGGWGPISTSTLLARKHSNLGKS